jgi:hypothetical protein
MDSQVIYVQYPPCTAATSRLLRKIEILTLPFYVEEKSMYQKLQSYDVMNALS